MPTYRDHEQLLGLVDELVEFIQGHSKMLRRSARRRAAEAVPPESPISQTWPFLQTSFHLLARHAAAVEAELESTRKNRSR